MASAIVRPSGVIFAVAAAMLAGCSASDARGTGGVADESKSLPELAGEGVSGPEIDSRDFLGSVLVVNVWATWCSPCRNEQPLLQATYERYQERGVKFLGINYRDNREAAATWIEDFGVTYPSLFDPEGRTASLLSFPFVPDTYIVDAGGTIRYTIFGETGQEQLSGLIEKVLGGPDESA